MELIHYQSANRNLKNPHICQFWTMNHAAGKSGQFLSIPSSFTHESLEQFALSLQYVWENKIKNEKKEAVYKKNSGETDFTDTSRYGVHKVSKGSLNM